MSKGRKRDKTYTRAHGGDAPSAQLKLLQRTDDHPRATSVQDRLVAPSPAEMRRAISNGECPFCGRKYRNIATHTRAAHGVGKNELKELAEIPKTHPACAPELSAAMSDSGRAIFERDPDAVRSRLVPKDRSTRSFSPAGQAVQLEKLKKAKAVQLAKLAEEGWHGDMAQIEWLAEHNHQLFLERTQERDAAIAARVREGAMLAEVLAEFGIKNRDTVMAALARHGVEVNFRSVRMKRPENYAPRMATMHDSHRRNQAQRRAAILVRWAELGKTWEAVGVLAAEFAVTERAMCAFLRSTGEEVPDGRVVSARRIKAKCRNGHERTEATMRVYNGKRICRICETKSKKRYLARKSSTPPGGGG